MVRTEHLPRVSPCLLSISLDLKILISDDNILSVSRNCAMSMSLYPESCSEIAQKRVRQIFHLAT
jgi:hypothetical protein